MSVRQLKHQRQLQIAGLEQLLVSQHAYHLTPITGKIFSSRFFLTFCSAKPAAANEQAYITPATAGESKASAICILITPLLVFLDYKHYIIKAYSRVKSCFIEKLPPYLRRSTVKSGSHINFKLKQVSPYAARRFQCPRPASYPQPAYQDKDWRKLCVLFRR